MNETSDPASETSAAPWRRGPLVVLAVSLVAALAVAAMIGRGYPGLHEDAVAYVVPGFLPKVDGHLVSPLYVLYHYTEPQGRWIFDFHGPLQVMLLRGVFRCTNAMAAVGALAALGGLCVAATGIVTLLRRRGTAYGRRAALLDLASLAIACQLTLYLVGRPELLILPLVEIGLLVAATTRTPGLGRHGVLGALAGLAVLASPQSGVVFALLVCAHAAWHHGGLSLVRAVAVAGGVAGVVAFGLPAIAYPYSLIHLAEQTLENGRTLGTLSGSSTKLLSYWLGRSGVPLIGVPFAVGGALIVWSLWSRRREAGSAVALLLFALPALALVARNSVLMSSTNYNVLAFTPALLCALADTRATSLVGRVRGWRWAAAGAVAAAAAPLAITLAGFGWYLSSGVPLWWARKVAGGIAVDVDAGERIGIGQWDRPTLFVVAPSVEHWGYQTFSWWGYERHELDLGIRYEVLLLQSEPDAKLLQVFEPESDPATPAPAFLDWVVGSSRRCDYAFTVYRRR